MNEKLNLVKRGIDFTLKLFCAFGCFFGITCFFKYDDFLSKLLSDSTQMKIRPSYIGGEIADDFFKAEPNDDPAVRETELIRYTVHQPVYDAKWQQNPEYWQLDMEFKNSNPYRRNLLVEFFLDGRNEYDYAMWIYNDTGKIFNSADQFICNTETYILNDGQKIMVRIPLAEKSLQKIFTARITEHSVFISDLTDDDFYNNMMPSKEFSSYKEIAAPMTVAMNQKKNAAVDEELIEKIISEYNRMNANEIKKVEYAHSDKSVKDYQSKKNLALLAFEAGETENAEKIFSELMKQKDDAQATAYYGSCIAIRGGKSNVMAAMKLVNESFRIFEKALSQVKDIDEEYEVLINRASVAASVPEGIFHKALTGAQDYERCAEIFRQQERALTPQEKNFLIAWHYAAAYKCWKSAGKKTEMMMAKNLAEKYFRASL